MNTGRSDDRKTTSSLSQDETSGGGCGPFADADGDAKRASVEPEVTFVVTQKNVRSLHSTGRFEKGANGMRFFHVKHGGQQKRKFGSRTVVIYIYIYIHIRTLVDSTTNSELEYS